MSSPIAFREFDPDEYRRFVQTLSDEELIKAGKRLRFLSSNGKIVTTMPCAFYEQLKICRAEYRRRHKKSTPYLIVRNAKHVTGQRSIDAKRLCALNGRSTLWKLEMGHRKRDTGYATLHAWHNKSNITNTMQR